MLGKHSLITALIAGMLLVLPLSSAQAWWGGGPGSWWDGDGWGDIDFHFSFGFNGSGWGGNRWYDHSWYGYPYYGYPYYGYTYPTYGVPLYTTYNPWQLQPAVAEPSSTEK